MQYVPNPPTQGALYHRLTTLIASNYSGLGPQNVANTPYNKMTGLAFQKPLSGATPQSTTVVGNIHR
jgi:hypothetical protein